MLNSHKLLLPIEQEESITQTSEDATGPAGESG